MFTGIITDIGQVLAIEARGDARIRIGCGFAPQTVDLGASIACSGVCLTVVDKGSAAGGHWFDVDVSAETLSRTTLGGWQPGTAVNLERSLRVGDELGGHIVSGHVDGVGRIESIVAEGDSKRFLIAAPAGLAPYLAVKGSVALDGVSLTINSVEDGANAVRIGVNIIPHTQSWTRFGTALAGDAVNIEIDTLARYVARIQQLAGQKG
jgi:riboflavin synthase